VVQICEFVNLHSGHPKLCQILLGRGNASLAKKKCTYCKSASHNEISYSTVLAAILSEKGKNLLTKEG
jgi:hypothetical protein